jgi:outer membrane protein assembly factor BamB
MMRKTLPLVLAGLVIACAAAAAWADDWPTYRHDAARSGVSAEALAAPLSEAWVFTPALPPAHAWGDPKPTPVEKVLELPRLRFDDAYHVAAVGDRIYFGSSADGKVTALDAADGRVVWEFFTEGPVRLAPTVAGGRVYVGSDDGMVYCLDAKDGRPAWSFAAAPSAERILGNGRMISVWPVRTGVVVEGGVAYFGAGVFPAEGLYLYAIDAATGKLLWKNDTYGKGGAGDVSPQGYLMASAERLFMPSGRSLPAAFSRADGQFLFHRSLNWRSVGLSGGTNNQLLGDLVLCTSEQIIAITEATGHMAFAEGLTADTPTEGARQIVADARMLYLATGKEVVAVDRVAWLTFAKSLGALKTKVAALTTQRNDLKIQTRTTPSLQKQVDDVQAQLTKTTADLKEMQPRVDQATKWRSPCTGSEAMALARGTVFVGGPGLVTGFDAATGKNVWSAPVQGKARGLAIANGRLIVSTDTGRIHTFIAGTGGKSLKAAPPILANAFPEGERATRAAALAERIIKESGATRGYALLLGDDGRLALELARRTGLVIYLVEPSPDKAALARKALASAGVYGSKVWVMAQPAADLSAKALAAADALPLADYFANLIVVEGNFTPEAAVLPAKEVLRMLKPCGGAAYLCPAAAAGAAAAPPARRDAWLAELRQALAGLGETGTKVAVDGAALHIARGPLNGAGSWTHEYGEPGNTACSDDKLVRGPIGILWFGDPGPEEMPSRHESNSAPLAADGRMFIEGENVVMAYDAYNGLKLWEVQLPGARRVGLKLNCSNFVLGGGSLFVTIGDRCLRLDPATGETKSTLKAPRRSPDVAGDKDGKNRNWAYIAYADGNLIGGTPDSCVFAMDPDTGNVRWLHEGKTVMPATICLGEGKVFFVDRTVTPEQEAAVLKNVPEKMRIDDRGRAIKPDVRLVVALDSKTGKPVWQHPEYVADCVKVGVPGGELTAMYAKGVVLLSGQPWNGHFWKEFLAGEFSRRSLIALAASDGNTMWSGRKGYRSRPLIVGDRIIAEPWSYDLSTGVETQRTHPITGEVAKWQMSRPGHHCGNIAASPNALFFRSGTSAYYDLVGDYGTSHFGAQRPGCWINCIPANGVVMMPEASSGCVCPFAIQCTIVFAPRQTSRVWGYFSAPGPLVPVKHLALAFGAAGDRKDHAGTLWLSYPRPPGGERLVLDFTLPTQILPDGGYFAGNGDFLKIAGTLDPWLYAAGCRGLTHCTIPVNAKGAPPSEYTVRLYFAETENEKAGARVFDVKLQGVAVLKDFDIFKEAGGKGRAVVKEFPKVKAGETLTVEFVSKTPPAAGSAMPIISGLEIIESQTR